MAISGIEQNYYQRNMTIIKNLNNMVEKISSTKELSEVEEMELFKKEFYEELSKIPCDSSWSNLAVNISEEAFKNMKDDPEYREKILSLIKRDFTSSVAPRQCSGVITVGATLKDYRGDSWPIGYDSEFYTRSQNSFYKRTSEKKDGKKELLKKYLEKREQMKEFQQKVWNEKIEKQKLERSRMSKLWKNKKQIAKVSDAYEANFMIENNIEKSFLE